MKKTIILLIALFLGFSTTTNAQIKGDTKAKTSESKKEKQEENSSPSNVAEIDFAKEDENIKLDFEIESSEDKLNLPKSLEYSNSIFNDDEGNVYMYHKIENKHFLARYDDNLKEQLQKELKNLENNTQIISFLGGNNQDLFCFTANSNTKNNTNELYYQEVNKEHLTLRPAKKIMTLGLEPDTKANIESKELPNYQNNSNFLVSLSSDSSKFLILGLHPDNKNYESGKTMITISLYKSNMSPLWTKEIKLNYQATLFDFRSYTIDNAGNVFILGKVHNKSRRNYEDDKINCSYDVIQIAAENQKVSTTNIRFKDEFMNGERLFINEQGNVVCTGFTATFKQKTMTYFLKGYYFIEIDPKISQIINKKIVPFDESLRVFLKKNPNKRSAFSGGKFTHPYIAFNWFEVNQCQDGGYVLVAERFHLNHTKSYGDVYLHDELIICKIDEKGNTKWTKVIPKREAAFSISYGSLYLNMKYWEEEGDVYILVNKFVRPEGARKLYVAGFHTAKLYKIDTVGNMTSSLLHDKNKYNAAILPATQKLEDGSYMLITNDENDNKHLSRLILK